MYVLSLDPGDTCGVALWKSDGEFLWKRNMVVDDFLKWLARDLARPLKAVVIEHWITRGGMGARLRGSKMLVAQAIGAAKLFALQHGAEVVLQQSSILRIAAMHDEVELPAGHIPNDLSAYLHGYYYFESRGILKPVAQR